MILRSLALLLISGAALLGSCTKTETVVETKTVHDTIVAPLPRGPAWVRFISMLPEAGTVTLWTDAAKFNPPLANALTYSTMSFVPIDDSVGVTLYPDYYVNSVRYLDSINIGVRPPYSLSTVALYVRENHDGTNRINAVVVDDSARIQPPPPHMCYVRFLNGMADYPSQPYLFLGYDNAKNSVWHDGTTPIGALATNDVLNYTLLQTGAGSTQHKLYATTYDGEIVDSVTRNFTEGHYYTVRVWGRKSNQTNRMSVDEE